jgi:hypothetical protein
MRGPVECPKPLKLRASDGPISTDLSTEPALLAELADADLGEAEFGGGLGCGEVFGGHLAKYIAIARSRQVDLE